jgi:hypothetical protein
MRWFRREREEDPAVTAEVERVRAALSGGPLTGLRVFPLHVPGSDDVAIAVEIEPERVLETWRAARRLVDELGRWPLAVASWEEGLTGDVFLGDGVPAAAIAKAADLSPAEGLARLGDAEVLSAIEEVADPLEDDADPGGHLDWFDPVGQPTAIAFLPTSGPDEAIAYTGLFPLDEVDEVAALVAILRGWNERFGAELVAAWGTMLQFVVERPPTDHATALELTREHAIVASDTLLLPGVSPKDHARALVDRGDWFLHSRP